MSAPRPELETELKDIGCPYSARDPRALTWLEGFRTGVRHGAEIAKQAILDEALERAGGR